MKEHYLRWDYSVIWKSLRNVCFSAWRWFTMPNINSPTVHPVLFSSTLREGGKKKRSYVTSLSISAVRWVAESRNQNTSNQYIHSSQRVIPCISLYNLKTTKNKFKSILKTLYLHQTPLILKEETWKLLFWLLSFITEKRRMVTW